MEFDFQIIANLLSGKGTAKVVLENLEKFLASYGFSFRTLAITTPTPISQIPSDGTIKIKKGVICLGGDGTVSETLGYVLNNNLDAPIALIPTGTANIIASTLGFMQNNRNFDFLLKNKERKIDIGVAAYQSEKRYFLLGMGLGFEEKFLKLAKEKLKSKFGIFSYIFAALAELLSLPRVPLEISPSGKVDVCLLTVFNLKPIILRIFPIFKQKEIKGDDGVLNIYYVEYKNYFYALLGTLLFHFLGAKNFGLVKKLTAKTLTLNSPALVGTQLDGELRANLPVKISIIPNGATFLIYA